MLLTACGGRSGTPEGTLKLDIFGLPAELSAPVQVSGPNEFTRTLNQSQTLPGLAPGIYTVSAANISNYTPQITGSPAEVRAGEMTQVSVTYRTDTGPEPTPPGPTPPGPTPPGPTPGPGEDGSISGVVSVVGTVPVGVRVHTAAPFVPGEVIVKFKDGLRTTGTLEAAGLNLERPVGNAGAQLYRASSAQMLGAAQMGAQAEAAERTLQLVADLNSRGDVLYAHPNYLLEAFAEPNDPLYGDQWHYRAINLPEAWEITTGSAVTVAVLDTGIATGHPDFAGKLRPGYNFVSAEGRSGDPTDLGDSSEYHGTHVAGTVATATDNSIGVAGVSWGARILPVRILGQGGGSLADTIDGIVWSVGLEVPGVPSNPNPAQVLNLSLGGPFLCSEVPALQEALDQAAAAGATVVAAAGNENTDASGVTPASCGGVITVGATDLSGDRASYSNYGPHVDLMAPGGDLSQDADDDGNPDGVLSTVRDPFSGEDTYAYFEGTSMATPHVAGLVALMKTLRPGLNGPQMRDILTRTARPISGNSCNVGCGAGLIDALAALEALQGPVTPTFSLSLSPATVTLAEGSSASLEVDISRSANFDDAVALSVQGAPDGLSASFSPQRATGSSSTLILAAAGVAGAFSLEVQGVGDGLTRTVSLSVFVEREDAPSPVPGPDFDVQGTVVFACPVENDLCRLAELPFVEITETGSSAPYTLPNVPAGSYVVIAWNDLNNNNRVDDGEPFGQFDQNGQPASVSPPANGIDITMYPQLGTQDAGTLGRPRIQPQKIQR